MSMIEDGKGSGIRAKVNVENRLTTEAVGTDRFEHLTEGGRTFSYGTPVIDLTAATETIIAVLINNGTQDVVFTSLTVTLGKSKETSGTPNTQGQTLIKTYVTYSSHDLPNAMIPVPYRSTVAIDISFLEVKSGVEGSALTGGVSLAGGTIAQHGTIVDLLDHSFFLPPGGKVALGITPPPGTSTGTDKMQVTGSALIHINEEH